MFKNYIYQNLVYLIKTLIPRKIGLGISLADYSRRMFFKVKLAKFFSGRKMLILGDSNAENLASYSDCLRFGKYLKSIVVNIAIGGTRADTWVEFFLNTKEGKELYEEVKNYDIILFNIGGNNVLQNKMDVLEKSLKKLKELFLQSYNCTIPPLHYDLLSMPMNKPKDKIRQDVLKANELIRKVWKDKTIDLYNLFVDANGYPYIFTHEDAVHFSQFVDEKIRIPFISAFIMGDRFKLALNLEKN